VLRGRVEAEAHVTTVDAALLGGTYGAPRAGKVTVGEYAPVWMATKVNLKPKTRAGYESLLEAQIQPRWSKAPLSGVTYGAASAWVAQMVVACQGGGTTVLSRAWDHLEVSASVVGLSVCVN